MILGHVALYSHLALFGASLVVREPKPHVSFRVVLKGFGRRPVLAPLGKFLHEDLVNTAYVVSIFIGFIRVSSLFWNPLSVGKSCSKTTWSMLTRSFQNVYSRRPMYLISLVLYIAAAAASGASRSYGELLAFRAMNGFATGVPLRPWKCHG